MNWKQSDFYKDKSRERLTDIAAKKIMTASVGALDVIEKEFGFLWGHNDEDLTPEQKDFRKIYETVRYNIFERCDHQISNLKHEMSFYDIVWNRYKMSLPIKPYRPQQKNDGDQK